MVGPGATDSSHGDPLSVCVVGLGYVGLTTAVGLAEIGHNVRGVDVDRNRVAVLRDGRVPLHEPGLQSALARQGELLQFTDSLSDALGETPDIVMIAVQTPAGAGQPSDLSFVELAARDVGRHLGAPATIVLRSTAPVGTTARVRELVGDGLGAPVPAASNPEFLLEGKAYEAFLHPDRIVVGVDDVDTAELLTRLFAPLRAPMVITDIATAELIKYAANAFLATEISFINEIADLAEAVGADVGDVSRALKLDKRIGERAYLNPGLGFGGSCLPKDLRTLIDSGDRHGVDLRLARAVNAVNEARVTRFEEKLRRAVGDLAGRRVAVWGLAFKAATADVRESPAIGLVERLAARGALVKAYDPLAEAMAEPVAGADVLCADMYEALAGAEALLVLTDWPGFAAPDFGTMRHAMRRPLILDGRNVVDADAARKHGFVYQGVGVPPESRVRA